MGQKKNNQIKNINIMKNQIIKFVATFLIALGFVGNIQAQDPPKSILKKPGSTVKKTDKKVTFANPISTTKKTKETKTSSSTSSTNSNASDAKKSNSQYAKLPPPEAGQKGIKLLEKQEKESAALRDKQQKEISNLTDRQNATKAMIEKDNTNKLIKINSKGNTDNSPARNDASTLFNEKRKLEDATNKQREKNKNNLLNHDKRAQDNRDNLQLKQMAEQKSLENKQKNQYEKAKKEKVERDKVQAQRKAEGKKPLVLKKIKKKKEVKPASPETPTTKKKVRVKKRKKK